MTSRATKAAPVKEEATEAVSESSEATPKPYAVYPVRGREIEFKRPTTEQLMVMRRLARLLDDDTLAPSRQLVVLAKILDAVSACMVSDDDVDYIDQLVLERKAGVEELAPMITVALTGSATVKAPTTGPRRVRRR